MGIEEYNKGRETPGKRSNLEKFFSGIGSFFERRPEPNRSGVELYNEGKNPLDNRVNTWIPDPLELISPKSYDWMNRNVMDPAAETIGNWAFNTVPTSFSKWKKSYESPVGPISGETERDYLRQLGDMGKVPINAIGNAAQFIQEGARILPRSLGLDVETEALWNDPERPPKHAGWHNPLGIHFDPKHAGIGATGYYLDALTQGWFPGYNDNPLTDENISGDIMTKWEDDAFDWEDGYLGDLMTPAAQKEINNIIGKEVDPDKWVKNNPQGNRTFDEWSNDYEKFKEEKNEEIFWKEADKRYGKQIEDYINKGYEEEMMDKYGFHTNPYNEKIWSSDSSAMPYSKDFEFGAFDPIVDFVGNFRDRKLLDYSDSENAGFLHGTDEILELPISLGIPGLLRKSLQKSAPRLYSGLTNISPLQLGGKFKRGVAQSTLPPFIGQGLNEYLEMRND
jgi:hypothetical protein